MASKAMQARLAAKANAEAGDTTDGEDVSGGVGADLEEDASTDHITETPLDGSAAAAPAKAPSAARAEETPEQAEAKAAKVARSKLLEEKWQEAREKRQAAKIKEQARAERQAAAEDRKAVAAEKARYDGLKTGSYRDTLVALGRDPAKTFAEMQREQIEASTPEAQARRQREEDERALEERFKPVLSELEQLRAERAQWAADAHASAIQNSYQHAAADPAFANLRIEYSDEVLLDHASYYDKKPQEFFAVADEYGVKLTHPGKGFSMHEVLQVLSAAQAAHDSGVQARRAAQRPAEHQSASPTVNGTAPRRNAGTAPGNGLASERGPTGAADSAVLSPQDRMRARARDEIRRSGG